MLVSTYQTGKLICARHDGGKLNTHFRDFPRPMGLAVAPGRMRSAPARRSSTTATSRRWLPRSSRRASTMRASSPGTTHFTGDIRIHEIAFARGELWLVATNFSCLATLDAEHSHPPLEATVRLGAHERGPLPPERTLRDRRRAGLRDGARRDRRARSLAGEQGRRRDPDRRRDGRNRSPRAFDAPLTAMARRAAVGARVGQGTISVADPDDGTVETVAGYRASPVALSLREAWRSSVSRRSARPPPSAGCR